MTQSLNSSDKELEFLSGRFLDYQPPKEEKYLLQYFKTDLQLMFLKYFCTFDDIDHFVRRTGYACTRRALEKLRVKINILRSTHAKAKEEMNLELLSQIEQGKFKV